MIEILMSDPGILLLSSLGLVATAVSIVRDTRTQLARARLSDRPSVAQRPQKIAA